MAEEKLNCRVVEPDTPEWGIAVANKRERAFALVEKEGISRQEIEQRYEAYRKDKGISFHDERLGQEVGQGQLLAWWHGDVMVAYAPVNTARLIGSANHGVFSVVDIWVQPGLNPFQLEQIVSDLLEQARARNAPHVQIHCDAVLASASQRLGGEPVEYKFQFNLT